MRCLLDTNICIYAAQAISLDVTLNVREFSRVQGLRFENWVDG
jgi:predicted nucleic acid-binding protein